MGRKSVPYVDENALLRMRLRDALGEDGYAFSPFEDGDEDAAETAGESLQAEFGAPACLTIEDLYRINRNRARIAGLLHSHRSFHGAQVIVVTSGERAAAERERLHEACAWVLRPHGDTIPGGAALMPGAMRPVH